MGLAAAAIGAVIVLAGCTQPQAVDPTDPPSPSPGRTTRPQVDDVWAQEIFWERCTLAKDTECATVVAPLDWDDPTGPGIELALARVKATGGTARLGSLLVNPGGPGASGLSFLPNAISLIGPDVRAAYDVVSFDPRGVGESTPVTCYQTTAELDRFFAASWPKTLDGYADSVSVVEPFAQACADNTGPLLGQVDTASAAKDLDLLRHLLGDERLNLLGYSYGSFLGTTYAELFPDRVGRLVLDGAIDPSLPSDTQEVEQARGFEAALNAYLSDCIGKQACPFRGSKQAALDQIHQLLAQIEAKPMEAGSPDGRKLTLPLAINGIVVTMYDDSTWLLASQALEGAISYDDGTGLLRLSDMYMDRLGGSYGSNQMEAFIAINCLDGRPPADPAAAEAHAAALAEASPTMGEFWAYSEQLCAVWPYPQKGAPHGASAPGADPILIIGTTGDPATPYQGAVALAQQLESAVLITYQGEGHTAYGRSNQCVNQAVERYLLEGTVPAEGLTC
jgi:pimeloyl-ACP methyl ester carboxylesterase